MSENKYSIEVGMNVADLVYQAGGPVLESKGSSGFVWENYTGKLISEFFHNNRLDEPGRFYVRSKDVSTLWLTIHS